MRKKLLLTVIVFQWITIAIAQPNGGFEDWTAEFSYEVPVSWQTLNFLSLSTPPNPISAFKAIGSDKHSGNYALKLKSVYFNYNPLPDSLLQALEIADTGSGAFTGSIVMSPFSFVSGVPYTGRPEKLELWSKYLSVGNDTGMAAVYLKRFNGVTSDTIAFGKIKIPHTPVYTFFEVPITYLENELPDSLFIGFLSSSDNATARINSTLYVDDVALTGWVGLDETKQKESAAKVYPNPARNYITVHAPLRDAETICLRDISGRKMFTQRLLNEKAEINTSTFSEGIYFYEILDYNNKVLHRGRFNVTK